MAESPYLEDNEPTEIVDIIDDTGRKLGCYVERYLELEDKTYLLLLPVDAPIEIFAWNEEDEEGDAELTALEEESEIAKVFPDASAVLAEQNLTLKHTGYIMTAEGELPPLDPDDILTIELDSEDPEMSPEEFQILARFYNKEQEYAICTPVDPLLFFGRQDDRGTVVLISGEESEKIGPLLEDMLLDEAQQ
jgi:Protein of unknown function (DUF3727)/Protein of unknown function (DUF1292)